MVSSEGTYENVTKIKIGDKNYDPNELKKYFNIMSVTTKESGKPMITNLDFKPCDIKDVDSQMSNI